ncbi:hypothetical protein BT67DRAFT_441300 [Trichocladium antarcticum]|uniref:Uncharacterized protein n=1 Tax=Trichocladium antarcticum TaxID=1450529 RepID=A0AAN6ULG1_9PEZI|nr:hypothetical protein BT67DRAFT_441300 [Trichocladium antarcticum]
MDPSLSSGTYIPSWPSSQGTTFIFAIRGSNYRSPHESHNSHKLGYMRYTRDQAHTLYLPFHSLNKTNASRKLADGKAADRPAMLPKARRRMEFGAQCGEGKVVPGIRLVPLTLSPPSTTGKGSHAPAAWQCHVMSCHVAAASIHWLCVTDSKQPRGVIKLGTACFKLCCAA